ncbi:hypothetical protein K0M31_005606 [Melipona bicolor]|uniref:Uncharacterized protein n=1 Tax=Melipona bicolor TaxID=60889 RepID=A0AA40KLU8_9HYME|nr:hypothetical protein K0M31_005606 [Melipona bicolor]
MNNALAYYKTDTPLVSQLLPMAHNAINNVNWQSTGDVIITRQFDDRGVTLTSTRRVTMRTRRNEDEASGLAQQSSFGRCAVQRDQRRLRVIWALVVLWWLCTNPTGLLSPK